MELRKRSFGLAVGTVCGLAMMVGTWLLLLRGAPGGIISSASGLFYGYTYTFGGSFVGLIWGFIYGFIGGILVAWFNDLFAKMIYKKKS